jgi:transcriptional regulator with XRE-family HTH domain
LYQRVIWYNRAVTESSIQFPDIVSGVALAVPNDLRTVADRVKWVREELLRLSMERLVYALGEIGHDTSAMTVSRVEAGRRAPEVDFLVGLVELANDPLVTLDWLVLNRQPGSEAERMLGRVREVLQMPADLFRPLPRPDDDASTNSK